MTGRRLYADAAGAIPQPEPGDYWRWPNDHWSCVTPNGHGGNLAAHDVVEHEDGTITVSPSILISEPVAEGSSKVLWHGYLERGVWREC